ncbi:signaling protein swift [Paecilomyces variotii]|uniref:Signaling protein swift n=1 Tax=Byssochlamys spectabilis TaxID=264951 RepID=A0A443I623_BYSSP|nr:signaling protein swift [Paecilomyces variotii]KAJ9357128.1 hypothetical protein DTO280E4_5693 [Paecilomyces variotii]RWQ99487.1 signaling protein swift [Paecilomyces variotii]
MADHEEGVQLFGQCKICIVCSKDFDEDAANQLAISMKEYGGETVIHSASSIFPSVQEFTHFISPTIDFPGYQAACDALIPVVKPQWVQVSIAKMKLANPRQHNPDPRLFLNDVVVTCGDIPEGDKDAIIGGVLAMGGLYSSRITAMVTHLVDLTTDSDKAKIVLAKKLNVKIVLPHWFDDCLKLGRRIPERPYILPDPEILRAGPDMPIRAYENKDIVGASTPEPSNLPSPVKTPQTKRQLDVFEGKKVMLSSDLKIGSHLHGSIESLIEQGGGSLTSDVSKADMFICRYREGFEYRLASRLGKDVGNLSWLYHLITHNTWTSPMRRLLHYPVSRTPIPGFKGLKISLSNYAGEARAYLENLIAATGAECTRTLRQDNTHLVTAHGNSEKCSAAKEWGLQVVNHLWLEESYAKWKQQPVSDPRYTHFPKRTNLGEVVGQTKLDKTVLEQLFFPSEETPEAASPARVMKQKDQNVAASSTADAMKPPKTKTKKKGDAAPDTRAMTPRSATTSHNVENGEKMRTPILSRLLADGKENDTPSTTSSRKSKEAAAARLHEIAPDIALYEKELKRVGGVIYGGRRKSDEDRITHAKKRKSTDGQEESNVEEESEAKRLKKSKPPVTMRLLITGFQRWVGNQKKEDADKRQLRELGIVIIQEARNCTHLAAPSILRTPKFVNALAYGPVIINVDFITQCLKKDQLLDPNDFILEDKAAESKYGFSLEEARSRAKINKNKLLRGHNVYCVESIRGGFEAFKSIVEINGGECALFRARVAMSSHHRPDSDESDDEEERRSTSKEVYLLSSTQPDQVKLWPRFRQMVRDVGKVPRIVRVDWLLDIAMSQELRWKDEYELNEDMIENAEA